MHRRIGNKWELITSQTPGKLEPAQVSKAVLDFAQKYGDFFDPDGGENIASYLAYLRHGGSRYNRFWVQEWEDIRQALALIEEGKEYLLMDVNWSGLRAELPSLNLKLQQFTVPEMRKKRSGSSKWAVGILPTCLAAESGVQVVRDAIPVHQARILRQISGFLFSLQLMVGKQRFVSIEMVPMRLLA